MHIPKEASQEKQNSPECTVREYPFPNTNIWIAKVKIDGRYPSKGNVVNEACDVICYILSGTGVITTDKWTYHVKEWDSVLLEKWSPYSVEGENLFVCLSSAPAWYFEQYKEIE